MRLHGGVIESNSQHHAREACSEVWRSARSALPVVLWAYRNTTRVHERKAIVSSLWIRFEVIYGSSTATLYSSMSD